ncbi:MAG: flagellar export chaperone FlgN [bacterium]|nr:flagellar export chaperone FlgN [bacterium]
MGNRVNDLVFKLIGSIKRQRGVLSEILDIVKEENEAIINSDLERLNSSIERQEDKKDELKALVDEILPVEKELAKYFKLETFSPEKIVNLIDAPLKDDLSAQLDKLNQILSHVMRLEEENEQMLEEKMVKVKEELISIKKERMLRNTYSKKVGKSAIYIDKNL